MCERERERARAHELPRELVSRFRIAFSKNGSRVRLAQGYFAHVGGNLAALARSLALAGLSTTSEVTKKVG